MHSTTSPKRAHLFLAGLAVVGLLVAACGGGAGASSGSGDGSGATGAPAGGGGSTATGEYGDETALAASVAKLGELESFSYETSIGVRNLGEDYLVKITGVERPLDGERSLFAARNDGVEWSAMTVGGEFFADIGRGLEPLDPREDGVAATDPNWISNLAESAFGTFWDDFVIVGEESIEDRPVIHYALDEASTEKVLRNMGEGFETFSADIWVDKSAGYLVRANFGRLPFPTAMFSPIREFHFELSDVGCACPLTKPA